MTKVFELADALEALTSGKEKLQGAERPRAVIECAEVRNGLGAIIGAIDLVLLKLTPVPEGGTDTVTLLGTAKAAARALRSKCEAAEAANRKKPL